MSHLPVVKFAPDAPDALECVTALTRCIVSGDFFDCAGEDPSNFSNVIARVIEGAVEVFDKPDGPVIGEDEFANQFAHKFDMLSLALGVQPPAEGSRLNPLWILVIEKAVEAFLKWLSEQADK